MKFYVYILRDPRPGKNLQPIYVGKGKNARARDHWRRADDHKNTFLRQILTKIKKLGLEPTIEIVRHFEIEAEAFQLEIELIAKYGRRDLDIGTLCNLTDGGEGATNSLAWNNPEFRKAHTERMRKQNADPANAERMRKRHADPEFAQAHAERARQLNVNPEFAKARDERLQKLNVNPEFAQARDERLRRKNSDPEFVAANAERMRKRQADPEFAKRNKERMRKLNADPEFRKTHNERLRKRNADPAFKAKIKAGIIKKFRDDPEFAKAHAERNAERMRKLNANPEYQAKCQAAQAIKRLARNAATNPVREHLATGPIQ
jgi:hypothetical protein